MQKLYLMHLFSAHKLLPDNPMLKFMPATSSANCGINSDDCHLALSEGAPPSMYDLAQHSGRVDRRQNGKRGENVYHVFLNIGLTLAMFRRIFCNESKTKRTIRLKDYMCILHFLTIKGCIHCVHVGLEEFFEIPNKKK